MGREHTSANVAPALKTLLTQINAAYPDRDKSSDGIWPSAAHTAANPTSDHEWGNALDIDDDLSGVEGKAPQVTRAMAQTISRDPRCKYTIHEGMIYKNGTGTVYSGRNHHNTHVHISVREEQRNDAAYWDIGQEAKVGYIYLAVAHQGDINHLSALTNIARQYSDKMIAGAVTFAAHAAEGANADAYIDYALKNGLECQSCTDGRADTMKIRAVGNAPSVDAEKVAKYDEIAAVVAR